MQWGYNTAGGSWKVMKLNVSYSTFHFYFNSHDTSSGHTHGYGIYDLTSGIGGTKAGSSKNWWLSLGI